MSPAPFDVVAAARQLVRAESECRGLVPFTATHPDFDEALAWAVAAERDRLRQSAGDSQVGYKLGWTSAAMRDALGIGQPNFGSLWRSMRVEQQVDTSRLLHPKAEPELAFRAVVDLDATATESDIAAGGLWATAIEVVDPRWESYSFDWLDNTADGSSAARYVTGRFQSLGSDLGEVEVSLGWDGQQRTGRGAAALGSPVAAVAYLLAELARRDEVLRRGMIVLTGGLTAPIDLAPGMRVVVTSPSLPGCGLTCV